MRELSQIIKEKVIRLFWAGHSYNDIAQQLDIAKGSVTNIIDEFRDGQISIPDDMADYVNELRRITVDLKKYQVSLAQLRSYQKLHNKLHDMDADSEQAEQWLDLLQITAASNATGDKYFDVVGWIADWSAETGKNCKEILNEYEEKLCSLDYFDEEIEKRKSHLQELQQEDGKINKQITVLKHMLNQTEEIYSKRKKEAEVRLESYLAQNNLSWKEVETVMAAMTEELIDRADVPSKKLDGFYEKLRQAGSLFKTIRQLESEAVNLRTDIEHLKKVDDEQWRKITRLPRSS